MRWLKRLQVETRHGDLFETDAEAIVVPVNIGVRLDAYTLGRQLLEKSGRPLQEEIGRALRQLPGRRLRLGQAITVGAHSLGNTEKIILVAWWGAHNTFTPNFIYKVVIASLRQAFEHEIQSLAMPLFGTGSRMMRIQDLASSIVGVLKDLDGLRTTDTFRLRKLYFVSDRAHDVAFLQEHFRRHLQ